MVNFEVKRLWFILQLIARAQKWLSAYLETGYQEVFVSARALAEEVDDAPVFVSKDRIACKKRQFQ
jgi:hypothetical protein